MFTFRFGLPFFFFFWVLGILDFFAIWSTPIFPLILFTMDQQPPAPTSEEVKKPRKRFVGRAKKAASDAPTNSTGAIEDGAVGFASKFI